MDWDYDLVGLTDVILRTSESQSRFNGESQTWSSGDEIVSGMPATAEWGATGMFMLKGLGDLADLGCSTTMIDMYR